MQTNLTTARPGGEQGGRWRAEGATGRRPGARGAAGFTLTELLIVIGLIVLVLALAVPAFQAMTGGRSVDAAQNQLSAILGAARSEAIGLQKVRGVFFYIDPASNRVNAALVQEALVRAEGTLTNPPDFFLDLVPDRDPVALPVGVGLQGIDNSDVSAGATPARRDDGYLGYNPLTNLSPAPPAPIHYGGVILFDGYGRVINKRYGFHLGQEATTGPASQRTPTRMGALLGYIPTSAVPTPPAPPQTYVPRQTVPGNATENAFAPRSQFGFILYDAEPFRGQGFTDNDPQLDPAAGTYGTAEQNEEKWIDQNGIPVLINRYNGTLVRGE
jgi:type II secretory pathway pseudopilin PulG